MDNSTSLPPLSFSISAMAASFVADFVNPKDVRYIMQYMHVQPHPERGVMVMATNGSALALFHDVHGSANRTGSATLTTRMKAACHSSAKALARNASFNDPEKTPLHQVLVRGGRLCCTSHGQEIHVDPLVTREDGTPTWEMPQQHGLLKLGKAMGPLLRESADQAGPRGLMSPLLMTMVCRAFERLCQPITDMGLLMHQPDPEGMNFVFQPIQESAFIVMMPMVGWNEAIGMDVHKRLNWIKAMADEAKGMFEA